MDNIALVEKLKKMGAFWSYSTDNLNNISDDLLIEEALKWGDVPEIKAVFKLFPKYKVQSVWEKYLLPDKNIYSHNYYLALIFFDISDPKTFLNSKIQDHNGRIRSFAS